MTNSASNNDQEEKLLRALVETTQAIFKAMQNAQARIAARFHEKLECADPTQAPYSDLMNYATVTLRGMLTEAWGKPDEMSAHIAHAFCDPIGKLMLSISMLASVYGLGETTNGGPALQKNQKLILTAALDLYFILEDIAHNFPILLQSRANPEPLNLAKNLPLFMRALTRKTEELAKLWGEEALAELRADRHENYMQGSEHLLSLPEPAEQPHLRLAAG